MFPILINFGPIKIYSAVFFALIAIIAGGYFIWQKAQDEDLSADVVFDFVIVLLFGTFIGGRIGYVLLHFNIFAQDPLMLFLTQASPGISFWGMVVGANLCGFYFAKKKKLSFSKYADVCVLGFAWAQVFIHFGNILSGSFAGKESNLWWGIELANLGGRRYPVQIIAFVYSLILLAVVSKMAKRVHFSGFLILLWLASNCLFLFLIDPFRADSVYLLNNVSVNQLIALVAFFVFSTFFYRQAGRKIVSDLKSGGRAFRVFAKSIVYIVKRKEARINLVINLKHNINKKWFAITAQIQSTKNNLKELIHVKKSKINRQ